MLGPHQVVIHTQAELPAVLEKPRRCAARCCRMLAVVWRRDLAASAPVMQLEPISSIVWVGLDCQVMFS